MLITFKSHVCGDVIMLENNAKEILDLLGKGAAIHQGIVTVEQLPQAIAVLKKALESDQSQPVEAPSPDSSPDSSVESEPVAIRLFQRAAPIIALLEQSLTEKVPVTWEAA